VLSRRTAHVGKAQPTVERLVGEGIVKRSDFDKTPSRRFLMLGSSAAVALAPAAWAWADQATDQAKILLSNAPPVPGPKRTLSVGAIDQLGPFANASVVNVGGALAAMLYTALVQCGLFLMVERDALAGVISEQQLAKSGVSGGNQAPQPGKILPARYLVVGSVTDFTAPAAGSGGGISFGGSTAITLGGSKGDVALDLRIVDTLTGEVVKAFKVQRRVTSMNVGVSGNFKGLPVATNQFFNTPIGDATRKALNDAVLQIAAALAALPWQGQVVEVDGNTVYINAGSEAGIVSGDRVTIRREAKVFTDPATGQVLSRKYVDLGSVVIGNVEAKMASGPFRSADATPARGDLVVYAQ
jgi:curli biogenesis system outer membrane secretion channel CsgG